MKLSFILKDSNYKLSQFNQAEVSDLESSIFLKQTTKNNLPYIKCLVRNKDIQLKPEEAIRQLYLRVLNQRYGYPFNRMEVEYSVSFGREKKKADIVIFDKDKANAVYIIIELKAPKLKDGKEQLKSYCNATGAPIAVWTNGDQISFYQRKDPNFFEDLTDIPNFNQTLADILNEKFTLEDLIKKDKLVNERKSLKDLIEEMEDEVLANAGVDVFEEMFKLIFAKLYDEWLSGQGKNKNIRQLEFRNTGQTQTALKNKIQNLFDSAKNKWEGVFSKDAKINLTISHLSVCVSSLENVKLFNSNLDVVDEAFEYLINKSSKGEKGQFFTPRYVIDMCVKMLNPKEEEFIIDTAAGSSGFPVHTIFHVWQQILEDEGLSASHLFSLEEKPYRCKTYVEDKVFAIDFDEKAVRVARTLNLIAGDGETNVLHLNTLDFDRWDDLVKQEDWQDIYYSGFKRLRNLQKDKNSYQQFNFDVLMANPPFAGDIKEGTLLEKYDLSKKDNGKTQKKVGRDILFIERNLDFLKSGGRMAIVLPQGRFNNSSDKYIRDYLAERCRILAVIGLHGNTFKPHTGTKTSVLLVQKWDDQLCPKVEDYNIFFATMSKSGKDNSGEKIYRKITSPPSPLLTGEGGFLLDSHNHLIVDHDLFNHDGVTEDGIAEAFIEFAKKEGLSFFDLSLSINGFDAVKYQQLMDRLEAIELTFNTVIKYNINFRFDSEFFKKKYFNIEKKLKQIPRTIRFSEIEPKILHPTEIKREYVEKGGVLFFRTQNLRPLKIDLSNQVFISLEDAETLTKNKISKNDVLITRTGANFGDTLVVSSDLISIASSHVFIVKNKIINQSYLAVFLNTYYGKEQINKGMYGGLQPEIASYYLKNILIPPFSNLFQKLIENLIIKSDKIKQNSYLLYQEAEELLLTELGLKDWQPTEDNITVKSFSSSFVNSGRLDAEYYQPKYDQLELKLSQFKQVKIRDIINYPVSSGSTPKAGGDDYTDSINGIPFIRAVDLKDSRVETDNFIYIKLNIHQKLLKKTQLKKSDVLFSIAGTVGRCAIFDHEFQANINQAIAILRFNETIINRLYLITFFNSEIGKIYLSKYSRQGLQTNLNLEEVSNLQIPIISLDLQTIISNKIKESFKLRVRSKQLLEIAKKAVEKAIETDEDIAIKWINEELERIGIKI